MKAMAIIGIILAAIGGFFCVSMLIMNLGSVVVGFGFLLGVIMLYFLIYSIVAVTKSGSKAN
jgi:hypothetical protein